MQKRIAVTGATGFVGSHLVAALAARGWTLRLLVRRWSPLPPLAGVEAEIVWGDLGDENALRQFVAGVDAVIHAAGLSHTDSNVDDEMMTFSGVTDGSFTGVTRGAGGTSAAVHATGAAVYVALS